MYTKPELQVLIKTYSEPEINAKPEPDPEPVLQTKLKLNLN